MFNDLFTESKGIFLNSVGIQTNLGMIYRNIVSTTAYCDSSKVVTDILGMSLITPQTSKEGKIVNKVLYDNHHCNVEISIILRPAVPSATKA